MKTMPDKHAFLSPSSAERWYHCNKSAWLCEQFPDLGSVFAAEGTEAHSLCEYLLGVALGRSGLVDPRPGFQYYSDEMEECCQGYVAYVLETVERLKQKDEESPCVYVEQRVDLRKYIPESMGTSDCIVVGKGEIVVIDFKYGMHRVPATSLQLRIYALGACELFGSLYDFSSVRMVVYQPRIGNVDTAEMSVEELFRWAREELSPRAGFAFRGEGEFAVGEWCRNCRARRQCRALAEDQLAMARFEFQDPPLLSDEEIAEVLSRVDGLISWAEQVRDYALQAALNGKRFAGWKLVEGKSFRKFTNDEVVRARIEVAGFDPYEKKKRSLTAIEQLMGKKEFDNLLSDLVVRQAGKPILVPENDKRPEYVPAKAEFTEINDGCDSAEE